jgi:predicted dehydrogenase
MSQLKVGLLGLGRGGRLVAAALRKSSWCELVAVASTQPQRLRAFAAENPNIAVHDDYRALIAGCGLDAIFMAIPPFMRLSYLSMAAERQVPVWMLGPPLANFADAQVATERFRRADCPVVVYRPWGIEPALQPSSLALDQLGKFFLADGTVTTSWEGDLDWRGEAGRGGGVLFDRGYTLVDCIVQAMGLPSRVYAAGVRDAQGRRRQPQETEDVAALVCHFGEGGAATVCVSRASGPEGFLLRLHATGGALTLDDGGEPVAAGHRGFPRTAAARPAVPARLHAQGTPAHDGCPAGGVSLDEDRPARGARGHRRYASGVRSLPDESYCSPAPDTFPWGARRLTAGSN